MKERKLLNIIFLFAITLLGILHSTNSYAASAAQVVNLWQGYNTVEFTVSFDDEYNTHTVKITAPNDQTEEMESSGYESCVIKMTDCPPGDYKIEVSAEGDEDVKAEVTTTCYGPVVSTEGTSLYEISSKISGLKYYFVDGNLTINWDEENVSSLNIKVTNPENMQVLEDTTIKGGDYTVPIPEYVDELEVYAVASSEAKIDGAGEKRTLKPVRSISADVEFPKEEITNRNDINFDLSCSEPVTVYVYDNDNQIYTNSYDSGEYVINILLSGVNNSINVYVEDENLNAVTYQYYIVKDVVAPTLTLSRKLDGVSVTEETIDVIGYVTGGAEKLLMNGIEIEFDSTTGRFAESVPLTIGANSVSVCAVDNAGNESTIISVITRTEGKEKNRLIGYLKFGGICLIVLVLIVLIVKKSKSMSTQAKEQTSVETKKRKKK